MKHISLAMQREHLHDIPEAALPEGYRISLYQPGDEHFWADIETRAGEFREREAALEHFQREYGPHIDEVKQRCLFLFDPEGNAIGTATAWRGDTFGEPQGRIHWVGIVPEAQGRKLAKPLLSAALRVLAELGHTSAYLTTQTTSWRAVNLYLNYGFVPHRNSPSCDEGWTLIEQQLGRND
ncbi:GNAT family N-acetyltransferase [Paenibacillus sp. HJGM_3]|uniref:GNAT family N-acetyltransferase n=1 Tax=Paenibacillus sp. HJGM_3 TaxID=3379816 RepID=UPI00385B4AA6